MKLLCLAATAFAAAAADSETVAGRVAAVHKAAVPARARAADLPSADSAEEYLEDEEEDYVAQVDPVRRALALAAPDKKEARRLGGVYGLCAWEVSLPKNAALVCDPPNSLPQICTLVCNTGFYSSGSHMDVACADAMCQGPCTSEKYDCKGHEIKYGQRDCDVTRYTQCSGPEAPPSGLCLETVTETCNYSFYEETSRPCCNMTQVLAPEPSECWTSGCNGNCDTPGVYHYYSRQCGDMCPPWRDPEYPSFQCSPCRPPTTFNPKSAVINSNAVGNNPPSSITIGCEAGYWGGSMDSYCMSYDGSFYPPASDLSCYKCPNPPTLQGELFERVALEQNADGAVGKVEFRCISGFEGASTFSNCDQNGGFWTQVNPPYCEVAATPSVSATASVTPSPSMDPELFTASSTPTPSPSETESITPSPSKSPRPPKVKGSRAPTQAPKLRMSTVPSSSASPVPQ